MATGDAVNPTQAPPSVPAPINRLCSILLLSVLLALTAPSGSGAVSGTVFKSASQFATPPSDVAGKNTSTKPPHVRKHLEPAISVPEGTTLEDCRKHPGLCQPAACELWRDDIKDRCNAPTPFFSIHQAPRIYLPSVSPAIISGATS